MGMVLDRDTGHETFHGPPAVPLVPRATPILVVRARRADIDSTSIPRPKTPRLAGSGAFDTTPAKSKPKGVFATPCRTPNDRWFAPARKSADGREMVNSVDVRQPIGAFAQFVPWFGFSACS